MWEIETYRDGPVVRTTLRRDGKEVELPWWLDTVTVWGARRKARRHIRRLESEESPDILLVPKSRPYGAGFTGTTDTPMFDPPELDPARRAGRDGEVR